VDEEVSKEAGGPPINKSTNAIKFENQNKKIKTNKEKNSHQKAKESPKKIVKIKTTYQESDKPKNHQQKQCTKKSKKHKKKTKSSENHVDHVDRVNHSKPIEEIPKPQKESSNIHLNKKQCKNTGITVPALEKLKIWYTNADVLTREKINELISRINGEQKPPDVIAVTEIKPKNFTRELSDLDYQINGYTLEYQNLRSRDSTRGIALFIRHQLCYKIVNEVELTADGKFCAPKEILAAKINVKDKVNEAFQLVVLYRSPNSSEAENKSIEEFFQSIGKKHRERIVVMGDFNRKGIDWHEVTASCDNDMAFIESVRDSYMTQHIKSPTRGRGSDEPSTLDLLFTTESDVIEEIEIDSPLGKSDHSMIKATLLCQPTVCPEKIAPNYAKANLKKMKKMLSVNWEKKLAGCKDVDMLWEEFEIAFKAAEKECVPRKIVRTTKRKTTHYFDRKTLYHRKRKYRLWQRFLETKDVKVYKEYCRVRNQVRRLTRKAVKQREKKIASLVKENSKVFWKYISRKTKMQSRIPDLYNSENESSKTKSETEKAEVLGKFFSSVFIKEPDWIWDLPPHQNTNGAPLGAEITKEDIRTRLEGLNPNKSPGPDGLHPKLFKELSAVLDTPLYLIFKSSLETGKVPKAWKTACITAIYKNKGNKHQPTNYRPISLTSVACKIMESIVRQSILSYMKLNKYLTNRQFGFLGGRSTVLQLLTIMDQWTEILDKGGYLDVVYCDFQKAFDTVPHERLVKVLEYYGINDPLLKWIKDFLYQRTQQVNVNGNISSTFYVTSGVPQGSVLGPLLFVIYINIMVEKVETEGLFLFADDVKVFKEITTQDEEEALQDILDKMYDWTRYSLLKFHPQKCEAMRIKNKRNDTSCGMYNIDCVRLATSQKVKDLGIVFNENLTFEEHINDKVNKANSIAGLIRRSFIHLDKDMFKILFTSIVRPHLEYGATIWNPVKKNLITIIENVQRRATKWLPGFSTLSYKERLKEIKLTTLQYRRYRGDMIELYKLFHDFYDPSASKQLLESLKGNAPERTSARNHCFTIYKSPYKRDVRRDYFKHRTIDQWNNLPASVVQAPSLNAFKNGLDNLWEFKDIKYDVEVDFYNETRSRLTKFRTTQRN